MLPNSPTPLQKLNGRDSKEVLSAVLKPVVAFSTSEVARKGQLSAIDQVVISLANFLGTLILIRFVSAKELGIYTVGFLAIYLVRAIQEGLIVQPLNSLGAVLDGEDFRRYVSATGLSQLALAVLCSAGAALVGWVLIATGNDTAGPTVFALWFAFFTWQIQEFMRRVFYTRGEVLRATINTVIANAVRIALLVFMGIQGQLSGVAGLDAIAWGALAAFVLGFWQGRRYWTLRDLKVRETWLQNWNFGRWVLGGTVANWVTVQLYPILTAGMISFAAAGAYQALQNLVAPVHVLLRASDTFLTPRIAKAFHNSGFKRLQRTLWLTYLIAGLPVAGLLLMAVYFVNPLLDLLRGHEFLPYAKGIYLMAVFYGLWYAYWPLQTALKAVRLSKPIFIANLLAIGSMFTIGIWAIHTWGVYGTIAGQALNALIINIVLWTAWRRESRKDLG